MSKEIKTKEKKVKSDKNDFVLEIRNGFNLVDEKIGKLSSQVDEKIDDLARATKNGFDGTARKEDVEYLKQRFDEADSRLDSIDDRLDGIGTFLFDDHRRRIEKLEIEMTELREVLSLNK